MKKRIVFLGLIATQAFSWTGWKNVGLHTTFTTFTEVSDTTGVSRKAGYGYKYGSNFYIADGSKLVHVATAGSNAEFDSLTVTGGALFKSNIVIETSTSEALIIKDATDADTVKIYHNGTDAVFEGDAGTGLFKFNKGLDVTGGITASGAGMAGSLIVGTGSDSVGYTGGTLDIYKTAAGPLLRLTSSTEDSIFIVRPDRKIVNGLTHFAGRVTVADDDSVALDADAAGWGHVMIGDNEEYSEFRFKADGTVTLIDNSANVVTTDTDAKLCFIDKGDHVIIKNRLGASKTIAYNIYFYKP